MEINVSLITPVCYGPAWGHIRSDFAVDPSVTLKDLVEKALKGLDRDVFLEIRIAVPLS